MTRAARTVDDLYRSHAGEVYRYAYAMLGNKADAEDVTQTTFVNALRSLERGERPRKPSNWLVTIAHNIVRQRWRQQQARPAEVELDLDVALEETEQEGPSIDDLVRALQRIPHNQREALVMRELEGRSYKEIEAMLEISSSALETLLFRARRSLAEELENVVTCERAELAMSKRLDGRLSRKDRRRLEEHLEECPDCAKLYTGRTKHRRAFGALSLLPLPFSFTFFRDAPSASAGTSSGLTTIGAGGVTAGGVTAAAGVTAASCVSSCVTGGLFAGGVAAKAVAVVAAASVAGGVGYEGVKHVREPSKPKPVAAAVALPKSGRPAVAPVVPARAGTPAASRGASKAARPAAHSAPASAPYVLAVSTADATATAPHKPDAAKMQPTLVWEIDPIDTSAGTSGPTPVLVVPAPTPAPATAHPQTPPPAQAGGTTTSTPPAATTPPPTTTTPTDPAPPVDTTTPTDPAPPADTTTPTDPAPPADTTTPTDPAPVDTTTPTDPVPPADPPTPTVEPTSTGSASSSATTDPSTPPADPSPAPAEPAPTSDPTPLSVG